MYIKKADRVPATIDASSVGTVTSWSLKTGAIPNKCPICTLPNPKLVLHHWGGLSRDVSVFSGLFR